MSGAMGRRALLLGGGGFIGGHLARALAAHGVEPVIFDRHPPQGGPGETVAGTVADLAGGGGQLLGSVDVIYHLAWSTRPGSADADPARDLEENVLSGLALLERLVAMERPPRLLFVSSGGTVYGPPRSDPIPEDHPARPMGAYGIGKLTFEHYLALYHRRHGLDHLIFRPGNPYGEGQDPGRMHGAVTVFLDRVGQGAPIEIWGDGEIVRDYFHVADLATALVAGLNHHPRAGEPRVFNVGSGHGVSLNRLVELAERVTGRAARVRHLPPRTLDVPRVVLDIQRIRHAMGWAPAISLEAGMARTWAWLQQGGQA